MQGIMRASIVCENNWWFFEMVTLSGKIREKFSTRQEAVARMSKFFDKVAS